MTPSQLSAAEWVEPSCCLSDRTALVQSKAEQHRGVALDEGQKQNSKQHAAKGWLARGREERGEGQVSANRSIRPGDEATVNTAVGPLCWSGRGHCELFFLLCSACPCRLLVSFVPTWTSSPCCAFMLFWSVCVCVRVCRSAQLAVGTEGFSPPLLFKLAVAGCICWLVVWLDQFLSCILYACFDVRVCICVENMAASGT